MKKSKMAIKSSVKKLVKKPIKTLGKTLSKSVKPLKKLLVKIPARAMSAKAKKPQVKVPAKSLAKGAAKTIKTKSLPLKTPKSVVMSTKATSAKKLDKKAPSKVVATPVTKLAGKEIKKVGKTPAAAPVVAAVLTKPAKVAKPTKAMKASASSERMCRELACENAATTKGYCRLDYIKNWKKIKRKEMILKEGKLNQYIEELVGKYPDKYIDVIRQDLSTEVNFNKVIHDLELDESIDDLDYDGDSIDALIGGIKKEIEDFGDEEF